MIQVPNNKSNLVLPENLTIEELFKNWKKEIEDQAEGYKELGEKISLYDSEILKSEAMMTQYSAIFQEVNNQYEESKKSLLSFESQQNDLIQKLTGLENQLLAMLPSENLNSSSLIEKSQNLNKEISNLEKNFRDVCQMQNGTEIENINEQNLSNVLNSYFEAMENIEIENVFRLKRLN